MIKLAKWQVVQSLRIALEGARHEDKLRPSPSGWHHKGHVEQDVLERALELLERPHA
jgi:hypothetical protein